MFHVEQLLATCRAIAPQLSASLMPSVYSHAPLPTRPTLVMMREVRLRNLFLAGRIAKDYRCSPRDPRAPRTPVRILEPEIDYI